MTKLRHNPVVPLFFLTLAGLSILSIGALKLRHNYMIRGIPEGLPQLIAHGGAKLGLNVALDQYDDKSLADNLRAIRELGVPSVKHSFYFCQSYDWDATDRIVQAVAEAGLKLVPLLDGCPQDGFRPPAETKLFAGWAGAFADRYRDDIDHYIVWDEPNLTDHWGNRPVNPADYAALLSASANAIRSVDPESVIIAAPLAPTIETGPMNLSDSMYLQLIYEAGAKDSFDIAAGKPYGFDNGPDDRQVDTEVLNFSHVILLREVMERNGDGQKALWAGNWGWNSLPEDWQGSPSLWGQVDEETQAEWTVDALVRARQEWPWMGLMFLENWEPASPDSDPVWGFSINGREARRALSENVPSLNVSYPGFWWAQAEDPSQQYSGLWRFSPEYGADIGDSGDSAEFRFWGTDVGLDVRRANYNARLYVDVDGQPANYLPNDGNGAALVLNSPSPVDDFVTTEVVAANLEPREHTLSLTALRGTEQWALKGFTVGYEPASDGYRLLMVALAGFAVLLIMMTIITGRRIDWKRAGSGLNNRISKMSERRQMALTALSALVVVTSGWFTWGEQAAGIYRRLGDPGQLALTAAFASIFYIAPSFIVYLAALAILFVLIAFRPAWGLALVAFSLPFYVMPKPMLGFRFSPVEVFLLLTLAGFLLSTIAKKWVSFGKNAGREKKFQWLNVDYAVIAFTLVATLSLAFTERVGVATNEWRVLIIEPAIFYFLIRIMSLKNKELWTILDAFILGGLTVALIGLGQYVTGRNLITAEGGLMRLRSVYGSPNNVALYLGRIVPILGGVVLMGEGRRRIAYLAALIPIGLAILLTYSKGSLLIGLPAAVVVIVLLWRRSVGGRIWTWLAGMVLAGVILSFGALQIPQIADRLNPQGETGFFRISLWRSSINIIRDHPVFGIGLDNFLSAYRGRYILDDAWQEPNLSHPHNLFLDFATRLGLLGLAAGIWMIVAFLRIAIPLPRTVRPIWRPVAVGIIGSLTYMILHGLVDHGFFLVDLAYVFYLLLGITVLLDLKSADNSNTATMAERGG